MWVVVQMKLEGRDSTSSKAGEGHMAILLCSFFKCTFENFITRFFKPVKICNPYAPPEKQICLPEANSTNCQIWPVDEFGITLYFKILEFVDNILKMAGTFWISSFFLKTGRRAGSGSASSRSLAY